MDYQGNYFPEDRDERESKVYRTVKGIFKWTMYGISFVIYAIIFYMLIVNSDSDILETNYMISEIAQLENEDPDDMELYRINAKVFMNEVGSLQLYNVDYSDEYGLLEMGIKFNAKKLTNNERGDCLSYKLYDSEGNVYPLEYVKTDSGGRYGFTRICFTGIDIDLDSNDLRYDAATSNAPRTDISYKLDVYRKSDNELLFTFDVYDNTVTFTRTDYDD